MKSSGKSGRVCYFLRCAMRGRARGAGTIQRGKKVCHLGAECPYQHEHQHQMEYSHHTAKAKPSANKKGRFQGQGHRLVEEGEGYGEEGKKCSYCKRVGHNIASCAATGADAERRRRAARREQTQQRKVETRAEVPRPLGGGIALAYGDGDGGGGGIPQEFLDRQRIHAEPVSVRNDIQRDQDRAYLESLQRDREREEKEEVCGHSCDASISLFTTRSLSPPLV